MLLSVFTPSHRARHLDACYASLAGQSYPDWEWIVVLNGGASPWRPPVPDARVKVSRTGKVGGVGAAKRAACALASGEVLVELDHDDLLASDCLAKLADAFSSDPSAVLVCSDWAQIGEDGGRNDDRFDPAMGWIYDDVSVDGVDVLRCHGLVSSPHNVGYIWYAPNHVRAFRRDAYEAAGGYDANLSVLDDQDLMCRLYMAGRFVHIPQCLYLQRVHADNTQKRPRTNASIQTGTVALYQRYIYDLASAWASREDLAEITLVVDAMPALCTLPGGIAGREPRGTVVVIDPERPRIGLADGSVGAIHAPDVCQHVIERGGLFNECYRVLAHGGLLFTDTPSTDGRGAFQDPRHRSFWNENSFWYVSQAALAPAVAGLEARFQVSHLRTWYPTPFHEQTAIAYVQANLLALKDGPRQGGPMLW